MLDHLQLNVMLIGSLSCGFSCVAMVHKGKLHFLFGDPLHIGG
jgi:hypothetical protein